MTLRRVALPAARLAGIRNLVRASSETVLGLAFVPLGYQPAHSWRDHG